MLKRAMMSALLGFGLIASSVPIVFAEDLDVKIDRYKIKEDKEDIAEGRTNVKRWEQVVNERRAARDAAKSNYDSALSKSGAKNKLTREAKSRYDSAERSVKRAERKLMKAQENLREDEAELNQAYSEMAKDKVD